MTNDMPIPQMADQVVTGEDQCWRTKDGRMSGLGNAQLSELLALKEEIDAPPYLATEIVMAIYRADPALDDMLAAYRDWVVKQASDMLEHRRADWENRE